jgi:phage recombination protein Bet
MKTEQKERVSRTLLAGWPKDEQEKFLGICESLQLDPERNQIYPDKRWTKNGDRYTFTISIDALRLIAERTGKYQGQTPAMWCGSDGEWFDVWLFEEPPKAAKVGVYKDGFKEPLTTIANWKSYVQLTKGGQPNLMWQKMGAFMLAKCAESLALRKAFPGEMAGVYTTDEMAQSKNEYTEVPEKERRKIRAQLNKELTECDSTLKIRGVYETFMAVNSAILDVWTGNTHKQSETFKDLFSAHKERIVAAQEAEEAKNQAEADAAAGEAEENARAEAEAQAMDNEAAERAAA